MSAPQVLAGATPLPWSEAALLWERLRAEGQMMRCGIVLLDEHWLAQEADLCARLGWQRLDFCQAWSRHLAPDARAVALTTDDITRQVLEFARSDEAGTPAVSHLDAALCFLESDERAALWSDWRARFPKTSRALLILLPSASSLAPDEHERELWRRAGRLACVPPMEQSQGEADAD